MARIPGRDGQTNTGFRASKIENNFIRQEVEGAYLQRVREPDHLLALGRPDVERDIVRNWDRHNTKRASRRSHRNAWTSSPWAKTSASGTKPRRRVGILHQPARSRSEAVFFTSRISCKSGSA
jgi:hypothetical protein